MDHIDSVLASLDLFSDLAENLVRLPAHFAGGGGSFADASLLVQIAFTFVRP